MITGQEAASHLGISEQRVRKLAAQARTRGAVRSHGLLTISACAPYEETHTYDILPDGSTGLYWADEILIGST